MRKYLKIKKDWEKRDESLKVLGFETYAEFLRSPRWQKLRAKLRQRPEYSNCLACGSPRVQLHHLHYKGMKNNDSGSIIPLCGTHHEEFHNHAKAKEKTLKATWKFFKKLWGDSPYFHRFYNSRYNSAARRQHARRTFDTTLHPTHQIPVTLWCSFAGSDMRVRGTISTKELIDRWVTRKTKKKDTPMLELYERYKIESYYAVDLLNHRAANH